MDGDAAVSALALGPWVALVAAALVGRSPGGPDLGARVVAWVMGAGFAAAAVIAVWSLRVSRPPELSIGATTIRLDVVALVMSMLVLGLSALIQFFAVRYLRGDRRQLWFVVTANLLTGFTVLMVSAGSVALFLGAWVGAGGALILLLGTYGRLHQAREGVRRAALRFVAADSVFIVAAVAVLAASGGDLPFDRLGSVLGRLSEWEQLAIAVGLVVPALARSSQIPFQGWLPYTLAAPTPVSALMHAGVVNAGGILLLRFAPAIASHRPVMILICLIGAATLVFATAIRTVRPDVKGRLVYSTMAQMGFMIMVCGLGLFAAAIFHLVAHSLYKSTLFLGAGAGVQQHATDRDLPARVVPAVPLAVAVAAASVIVAVGALLTAELAFPPGSATSIGLLAFVALTASVGLGTALNTDPSLRTVLLAAVATVGLGIGYVAFQHQFISAFGPTAAANGAPAWLLVLPAAALIAIELLARNNRIAPRLRDRIYAAGLTASLPRTPTRTGVSS